MIHGTVQINHIEFVTYEITNEGASFNEPLNVYRAVVSGHDYQGYKYDLEWVFEAKTSAPGLVGMVLTEVDRRLNTKYIRPLIDSEQRAEVTKQTEEMSRVRAQGASEGGNYLVGSGLPGNERSDAFCSSTLKRRYGSAKCDLEASHKGLHKQHVTNLMWTTERAAQSWEEEDY